MIAGKTTPGNYSPFVVTDTGYLMPVTLPRDGVVLGISVAVDGLGPGHGDQVARGVIYSGSGTLLSSTASLTVANGQGLAWLMFTLPAPLPLLRGTYHAGMQAGPVDDSMRLSAIGFGATGLTYTDTYSDGPASSLPTTAPAPDYSIWVAYTIPYEVPGNVTDDWLATLNFADAQSVLSSTGVLFNSAQTAVVGWHGTLTDPQRGSFCIVSSSGPLADLVGERVKVSKGDRSVYAYCHTDGDILEDLSLTRRAFMALDYPATTELEATVEIMAAST